jgi:predicted TIM-barrel fold metal-dependent hydrolase
MTAHASLFAHVDVSAWIGGYPFRDVPHPDPEVLVRVLQRERVARAWVGWLPSAWQRDPSAGNAQLLKALAPWREVLDPAPAVRPDWPGWTRELGKQVEAGAAAIRVYPAQWGLGPGHPALVSLARACQESGLPLHITVRVEDLRQRHPHDVAGDVPAATVRSLARAGTGCTLVISGGGREFIEEVAWGLTPEERARVWFDFGWVWGPPDDQFATLVRGLGSEQLVYGSQWPLRLVQQSRALVSLAPPDVEVRLPFSSPTG